MGTFYEAVKDAIAAASARGYTLEGSGLPGFITSRLINTPPSSNISVAYVESADASPSLADHSLSITLTKTDDKGRSEVFSASFATAEFSAQELKTLLSELLAISRPPLR